MVAPGIVTAGAVIASVAVAALAVLDRFDDPGARAAMLRLVDDASASPLLQLIALAVAAGVGAMHALGPGHGKLLIGGYLASSQGRARDAFALGGIVALMHTGSVLVLGIVFHLTARVPDSPTLNATLGLVSAAAITAVGVVIVVRQVRDRRRRRQPHGAADGGGSAGPGSHAHGSAGHGSHAHDLPAGVQPMSRTGVIALATSGGLLPSPAAFAVLVTALAIGRSGYGLALVAAFSAGLALTLAVIGLMVLAGRGGLRRGAARHPVLATIADAVPVLGGATVVAAGVVLVLVNVARL